MLHIDTWKNMCCCSFEILVPMFCKMSAWGFQWCFQDRTSRAGGRMEQPTQLQIFCLILSEFCIARVAVWQSKCRVALAPKPPKVVEVRVQMFELPSLGLHMQSLGSITRLVHANVVCLHEWRRMQAAGWRDWSNFSVNDLSYSHCKTGNVRPVTSRNKLDYF